MEFGLVHVARTFAVWLHASSKVSLKFGKPLRTECFPHVGKWPAKQYWPIRVNQSDWLSTVLIIVKVSAVIQNPSLNVKFEVFENHFSRPQHPLLERIKSGKILHHTMDATMVLFFHQRQFIAWNYCHQSLQRAVVQVYYKKSWRATKKSWRATKKSWHSPPRPT